MEENKKIDSLENIKLIKKPECQDNADKIVDYMTLFDDTLMSMVFSENIEATEVLLRVILGQEDIKVINVHGQKKID